MIICPICGKENEEGSKFCIECGRDLTSKEILNEERNQIELGGRRIPSPALLEKEKVLGEFRASFWDLGIIGFILRYREKIVVTTHRIFYLSKRFTGEYLRTLFLRKVEDIEIGSIFNLVQFLVGVVILIASIFGFHERSYGGGLIEFGGMPWYIRLFAILIAIVLTLTASKKALKVTVGDSKNAITLPITRLKKKEAKCFIDLVSKAAEELNSSK